MNSSVVLGVKFFLFLLCISVGVNVSADELTLLTIDDVQDGQAINIKLKIILLMTTLTLLPTIILLMTSFTRILVVLAILRQALGLAQSPPNRLLIAIALMLTLIIMRPVGLQVYDQAIAPLQKDQITLDEALAKAETPIRQFMLLQIRENELEQVMRIAGEDLSTPKESVPFGVLLPAFVLSELTTAFQIGFMIFLPFLIIDLIVSSILMSMGMMMLSPMIVSLPFKLMVFVMADGWTMITTTLAATFGAQI